MTCSSTSRGTRRRTHSDGDRFRREDRLVKPRLLVSALPRLVLAVVSGAAAGVAAALAQAPDKGVLVGIAVSGTVFVVLGWWVLWPMDAATTKASVTHEDFDPRVDELVVMGAALLGLGGIVGLLLAGGANAGG